MVLEVIIYHLSILQYNKQNDNNYKYRCMLFI